MLGGMQKTARRAGEESAWELREALRRKLVGGVIGGGGEARKRPGQVAPFVDTVQLAGAEDGVEDGGAPAGVGVADKEEILFSDRAWAYRIFHFIGINVDVAVAGLSVAGQF